MSVPASFRELITTRARIYAHAAEKIDDRALTMDLHPEGDRLYAFDVIGQRKLDADLKESVSELPAAERAPALRAMRRQLGGLIAVSFDDTGRMVLPPMLKEFAGIGAQALFWGVGDGFEIWDPEAAKAAFVGAEARKLDYLLSRKAAQ